MRTALLGLIISLSITTVSLSFASSGSEYYAKGLCHKPGYRCLTIKPDDTWKKLFPNEIHLDIAQRINRTNMRVTRNKTIVVPVNFDYLTLYDVSPFPRQIKKPSNKVIIIDQERLAWGAYDPSGKLIKWGPISSGKDFCPDIGRACITRTGIFYMFNKKDKRCESNIFPVGRGGARMPYCMFFYRGYALHGSADVPGYRASHGCIRLFTRDAKWLNEEFIELSNPYNGIKGTMVVIQKLSTLNKE